MSSVRAPWLWLALTLLVLPACGAGRPPRPGGTIPAQLLRQARPIGVGARFHPPVRGPVGGRCRARLGGRFGVHVEVFAADRVVILPAGIGTAPPHVARGGRIARARCYGDLVTLDTTGIVLVRPGPPPPLSRLLRAWGRPLSRTRLAAFRGRVRAFVDGRRWRGAPGKIPLARHAEIVLEIGPHVPPHAAYTFPNGL